MAVLPGFELGSLVPRSRVLSVTPRRLYKQFGILIYIKFRTGKKKKKIKGIVG